VCAALACELLGVGTAQAQSGTSEIEKTHIGEAWAGGEVARKTWSVHSGVTWAPFGTLNETGLRLRMVGGFGGASYTGTKPVSDPCGIFLPCIRPAQDSIQQTYRAQSRFADLLFGYQFRVGELTLKAFAGAVLVDRKTTPFDEFAQMQGRFVGAKLVAEAWYNITPQFWSATDLAVISNERGFGARQRFGWRILEQISIGVDAGVRGHLEGAFGVEQGVNHMRIGALLRYDWPGGEVSATGGWAFDKERSSGETRWSSGDPFAMVTVLMKF
jgi:hypothetical protein